MASLYIELIAQAIGSRIASRSPVVAHLNRQLREGHRRHASVSAVRQRNITMIRARCSRKDFSWLQRLQKIL